LESFQPEWLYITFEYNLMIYLVPTASTLQLAKIIPTWCTGNESVVIQKMLCFCRDILSLSFLKPSFETSILGELLEQEQNTSSESSHKNHSLQFAYISDHPCKTQTQHLCVVRFVAEVFAHFYIFLLCLDLIIYAFLGCS